MARRADGARAGPPPEHGPDLAALLSEDHVRLRQQLAAALAARHRQRRGAIEALIASVVSHEVVEQELAHPLLESFEGGAELRRELLTAERSMMYLLLALRRASRRHFAGDRVNELLEVLRAELDAHLLREEGELLPALIVSERPLARQVRGTWARRARLHAHTRPHPHAPQRPLGLLTLGPLLAVSDRIRDRVRLRHYIH